MDKPTAQYFINKHWETFKHLGFKELKHKIKDKCDKYDNNRLMKWFNLKKVRENKKAKTEIEHDDVGKIEDFEDFETFNKARPPTTDALKKLPITSISQNLHTVLKPTVRNGKQVSTSSLGPGSSSQYKDILMEKESSEEKQQSGQDSSGGSYSQVSDQDNNQLLQSIEQKLTRYMQWKQVSEIFELGKYSKFCSLAPSYELYMSFAVQAAGIQIINKHFVPALAASIRWLIKNETVPSVIYQGLKKLFETIKIHPTHSIEDLQTMFTIARECQSSLKWLDQVKDPYLIIPEMQQLSKCAHGVQAVYAVRQFYSWEYFKLANYLMECHYGADDMSLFLEVAQYANLTVDTSWVLLFKLFVRLYSAHGRNLIKKGRLLLYSVPVKISFAQLLYCTDIAIGQKKFNLVKTLIEKQQTGSSQEELQMNLDLLEEELHYKQSSLQHVANLNAKEEEQIKIAAEEKQRRLRRLEEDKKQEELQKEEFALEQQQLQFLEEQKMKGNRLQYYHELCTLNAVVPADEAFLEFVNEVSIIALEFPNPIQPRAEQLALMYIFVSSPFKINLCQLPTGTGKSLMFGLLARYYNLQGKKVAVVVPKEVLAAVQQDMYSPRASKSHSDVFEIIANTINYCTYEDFLTAKIPLSTICLVDEIDSLFFADSPKLEEGKLISAILLLNKYQFIGMSATFRGEEGTKWLHRFLKSSNVVQVGAIILERILNIDVFGKLNANQVKAKVIETTKTKQQKIPVIIVLPTLEECNQLAPEFETSIVFGQGRVPEQVSCAEEIQTTQENVVVLTTYDASLGMDFTPLAYVIQTVLPDSWSVFVQNAGRSNRVDATARLEGALITTSFVSDINSVKKGCEYEQQRAKLFAPDYLRRLEILEACAKADATLSTFTSAFKKFKQGVSAAELYKVLSKVTKFKVALEVSGLSQPVNDQFKVPIPVLGKRTPPKQYKEKKESSLKIQATEIANTLDNFLQSPTTKRKTVGDDEYSSSEEGKWFAGQNGSSQENQVMIHPDESVMLHDQSKMNHLDEGLSEAVVEDLERQQYQALHAKFGGSGKQQAVSGTASPQSKTSSQMLGLDNVSESSAGIRSPKKKREQKHQERQHEQEHSPPPPQSPPAAATNNANKRREQKEYEKESVKSGGSHASKVSRSTNGRYEGGQVFGNHKFIMKGLSKGGKQQWRCTVCQKKTVEPQNHKCE